VSPAPFRAPGPDDDEPPLPGDAAQDDAELDGKAPEVARHAAAADPPPIVPGTPPGGEDDYDADADLARWLDDIDSGREPIPPEEDPPAPPVMFALGETAGVDPAVLAAMAGPDGLGGQAFSQEQAADAMPPGPLLAALTENAAAGLPGLSDDGVLGVISAARRQAARAEYLELTAIAELTARRQAQLAASIACKDPRGQTSPPRQASYWLETRTNQPRCHAVDHAIRPHLHHHTHRLRPLTPESCPPGTDEQIDQLARPPKNLPATRDSRPKGCPPRRCAVPDCPGRLKA